MKIRINNLEIEASPKDVAELIGVMGKSKSKENIKEKLDIPIKTGRKPNWTRSETYLILNSIKDGKKNSEIAKLDELNSHTERSVDSFSYNIRRYNENASVISPLGKKAKEMVKDWQEVNDKVDGFTPPKQTE